MYRKSYCTTPGVGMDKLLKLYVKQGSQRPSKVLENDLGPGKLLEF